MRRIEELILRVHHGTASRREHARLHAWNRRSPSNSQYSGDLDTVLKTASSVSWAKVAQARMPPVEDVITLSARLGRLPVERARLSTLRAGRWFAAAAVAAGLSGIALAWRSHAADTPAAFQLGTNEIVTGASERTTVRLGDGTIVRLGPESRLVVMSTPAAREVWLSGRAYFAVPHVEGLPFRVRSHAGDAVVLGTRFDLQVSSDDMRVLVVEGAVKLSGRGMALPEIDVEASEIGRVALAAPPQSQSVEATYLENELSWLGNFLVFEDTPLAQVARELSRHYEVPVDVLDSTLAEETVRALFVDEKLEDVVSSLCRALGADCSIRESGVVIAP
jgi:transmembrane sensor